MMRRFGLVLLLLAVPTYVSAQEKAAEDLLPATTQVYLRWDGTSAHREAFDKTALGKILKGEGGKFIDSALAQLQETLTAALTLQELIGGGVAPEELQKMQKEAAHISKLPTMLADNGFLMGIEIRSTNPPSGQVTLIVPGGGEKPEPITGLLRLVSMIAKMEIKENKTKTGTFYSMVLGEGVTLGWWTEGKNLVLIATTEKVEDAATKMRDGKHERLTTNPLYKKVKNFKDFAQTARAYIDIAALTKLAATVHPDAPKIIDLLGLEAVTAITFVSGFEDVAERGLMEIETKGDRKGLMSVLGGKPFKLSDLPPMPSDVVTFSMTSFDLGNFYDTALSVAKAIAKIIDPNAADEIEKAFKQADEVLGIDIRKDLLGSLGDRFVTYTAPSDGLFSLGQVFMVKVKDADRLRDSLDTAIKAAGKAAMTDVTIKKKKYHDVILHEVHVKAEGFVFLPTYAIHKDWIIFAYFPQPVQAAILRSKGDLEAWKPDEMSKQSLEKLPRDFISLSMSDPTPATKLLMSVLPLGARALNSFQPDIQLDVGALPPSQVITKHLFPNVSVATDDGKTLKYHTRSSLALPADVTSLETQFLLFFFLGFARAI